MSDTDSCRLGGRHADIRWHETSASFRCSRCAIVFVPLSQHERTSTENKALRAALQSWVESMKHTVNVLPPDPVYDALLAGASGYGALMTSASRLWRERLVELGGEFVVGPCRSTVERLLKLSRKALANSGEPARNRSGK